MRPGDASITGSDEHGDSLERQFHPFVALTTDIMCIESDLVDRVRNAQDIRDLCSPACGWKGVGKVREDFVEIGIVTAVFVAVVLVDGVEEVVAETGRLESAGVVDLEEGDVLRVDDRIGHFEVEVFFANGVGFEGDVDVDFARGGVERDIRGEETIKGVQIGLVVEIGVAVDAEGVVWCWAGVEWDLIEFCSVFRDGIWGGRLAREDLPRIHSGVQD